MVYAVVMPVSSIKNVMRVLLVISTLLHVKVNIRITLILGIAFVISFSKFQLVIVIQLGQLVLHVMSMVFAVVKLTSPVTNVILVLLFMKTFLHVKK